MSVEDEEQRRRDGLSLAREPLARHEVTHTASVIMDLFDRNICSHPVVEFGEPEVRDAAGAALDALCDFYQLCGRKFLT